MPGQRVDSIDRRGKYLIFNCPVGSVLFHLGMTGYLRILSNTAIAGKHDHFDMVFEDNTVLRLNDVRRFGTVLWVGTNPQHHKFLGLLGPEPLTDDFDGNYVYQKSRTSKVTVKQFIMNHKIVAGIGNIYANEILFHAGIHPSTLVRCLSIRRCNALVSATKSVLTTSISYGGTMLDLRGGTEKSGYFPAHYTVYNRADLPCTICARPIQYRRLGQRSIYFCTRCQKLFPSS